MRELAPAPGLTFSYGDLVGTPFKLGGRGPEVYDCYGLLMELARRAGTQLPDHRSPAVHALIAQQIDSCISMWTPCEPGPGAVVTFRIGRHVGHVGMVLPFGRMIHCWDKSGGVCTEPLDAWTHRIDGYYRYETPNV